MKKKIVIISLIIIAIILVILGYFVIQGLKQKVKIIGEELIKRETNETTENGTIFKKEFGSYELPKNWIESKKYSTTKKFFYVLNGQEQDKQPNNISVNLGKNKYAKSEHEKFRKAILNQLLLQIGNKKGIDLKANGSTTEKGEIVYTFIIKEDEVVTTQYYIVGDYKYILIQETAFEESEEIDNATKSIINSFKWKE